MKSIWLLSIVFAVSCTLLLHSGCEEQATVEQWPDPTLMPPKPLIAQATAQTTPPGGKLGPRITFDKVIHDFGQLAPQTTNLCQFNFTNTGNDVLKIREITTTCNCTPYSLAKAEYAPGESGVLKVGYYPGLRSGASVQRLAVLSNDMFTPKVELAVKATIVVKVAHEPAVLDFVLKDKNANCPPITLTSVDNQPFSIKQFRSTANSITADCNSSMKATKFVIQPEIDVDKLMNGLEGVIEIDLTHPQCNKITIPFVSPPRFKINPPSITIFNAQPEKPMIRKVQVLSSHGEDFRVDSVSSKNNLLKVLRQQRIYNGYEFEVQITPPATKDKGSAFSDMLFVNIKGGQKLQTTCNGFYRSKAAESRTTASSRASRRHAVPLEGPQNRNGKCEDCTGSYEFTWQNWPGASSKPK